MQYQDALLFDMELFFKLIHTILLGFSLSIIITSFLRLKKKDLLIELTDSATIVASITALFFLFAWSLNLYTVFQNEEEYHSLISRMTGRYWFGYWMYPIAYGVIPQLLWFKFVRRSKWSRIVIALLLLFVLYFEVLVIAITSIHRDYVPLNFSSDSTVFSWVIRLVLWRVESIFMFLVVLAMVHFVRTRTFFSKREKAIK